MAAGDGGTQLVSGYLFISEMAEGTLDPARLWVTKDGIRQGDGAAALSQLSPQDYLLLLIECTTERDDYRSFSYIADPFNDALAAKADGDDAKAKLLIAQAKKAVQKSADFTAADSRRIRLAIDAAFADDGWETPLLESAVGATGSEHQSPLEMAINRVSIVEAEMMANPDGA